jgi:hypothetical protein
MKFSEQFALHDLDQNAISALTAEWLFDREHGEGANRISLAAVKLRDNMLYLQYRAFPTYVKNNVALNADGGKRVAQNYDVLFQFQQAVDNVGNASTYMQFSPAERSDVIRDYINNGLARVWCSCGAYYYQGHWEDMASHDSAVFPFPGPKGKGVWRAKHAKGLKVPEIRVCKHIAACIHHMDKDITRISQLLSRQMKAITPPPATQPPTATQQPPAADQVPSEE